ncbi:hypothetical protein [Bacillus massilinigeriensis]|uniref:hypothetical protein n=1 Tax=Bacillus mediterraneensis TaxID=1805474 RepID=UPI0008F83B64|nr:hypothetical protein [Bacillus mediterraneensis]
MRSLQDSLYNWLTIKIVSDARPEDKAARETAELFASILADEYGVRYPEITVDEELYYVQAVSKGEEKKYRFPRELVEGMLSQINNEPEKYVNYPEE